MVRDVAMRDEPTYDVVVHELEDEILRRGSPSPGQRATVFLVLDLDLGSPQWRTSSPTPEGRYLRQSQGSLILQFAGTVARVEGVEYPVGALHHREFLLNCGLRVTAFSKDLVRSGLVRLGDCLEGTGILFGHLEATDLTVRQKVDAIVRQVRKPAPDDPLPENDWLILTMSLGRVAEEDCPSKARR